VLSKASAWGVSHRLRACTRVTSASCVYVRVRERERECCVLAVCVRWWHAVARWLRVWGLCGVIGPAKSSRGWAGVTPPLSLSLLPLLAHSRFAFACLSLVRSLASYLNIVHTVTCYCYATSYVYVCVACTCVYVPDDLYN